MTVNGTFTLLGTIDGVEGADSKTVLGNLVLTKGGTIGAASSAGSLDLTANLAKLAVSGDLTAQNATINADEFTLENGTLDNLSAEINGTKATLGNGAKLVNKGGFHYDTIVLGAGSTSSMPRATSGSNLRPTKARSNSRAASSARSMPNRRSSSKSASSTRPKIRAAIPISRWFVSARIPPTILTT